MMKIGVIGAGVMGRGIACSLIKHGHQVVLIDITDEILKKAETEIYNLNRFSKFQDKNALVFSYDEMMSKILFSKDISDLIGADFVIENITEDAEMKRKVYSGLDSVLDKDTVIGANTSCISITKIGSYVSNPSRVIGMHFMNPVTHINTIEVIKGYHTSAETINTANILLESIGKKAVIVEDYPGFVANRISHLIINEAASIVEDSIASAKDVDEIFKKCYGHKMGPLETADLIGLDTVVNSLNVLYNGYKDSKYATSPLLNKMVEAGLLGCKSGEGFYKY